MSGRITENAQGWLRLVLESAGGEPRADWLRHLAGLACHREVVMHEFLSGTVMALRPGRCVWLPSVTADWCGMPKRCHALQPDPDHREEDQA